MEWSKRDPSIATSIVVEDVILRLGIDAWVKQSAEKVSTFLYLGINPMQVRRNVVVFPDRLLVRGDKQCSSSSILESTARACVRNELRSAI